MDETRSKSLPAGLASELETRFFWWKPVGAAPRSDDRILAQAMNFAGFAEVRRLERMLGAERLASVMLRAQPGWIGDRSWAFWCGRLSLATQQAIPPEPPRRKFDDPDV